MGSPRGPTNIPAGLAAVPSTNPFFFHRLMCGIVDIYEKVYAYLHMHSKTQTQRAIELARRHGTLTARVAASAGIHSQTLTRLVDEGRLARVVRGQYRLPDAAITEHHGLALVAGAVPASVVCLLSAVAFHGVGTQVPAAVWIAVDRRARKPALQWPPVRVFRFGGESFTAGVETHDLEGVSVNVYSLAKSIADLFKYRNKVGLDVALEVLREAWLSRRVTVDELTRFAAICRVERVIRPYLEATVV
jgi:predicted transcriptional regulator of viral defense system